MSENQNTENTGNTVNQTNPNHSNNPNNLNGMVVTKNPAQTPVYNVIEHKSGGKGLATGALVLAIIALGASGFLFVQGQNVFTQQKLTVEKELANAALGESENARKLANSLDEQAKLNNIISQLDVGQQQNRSHIADVQRAYQELLKGRVNWLVDEVEVTLNLASQQLLLSGNVPVAITVLESIEQRLSRFEQSDLLPIKKAVSSDLAALKSRPYVDVSGTVLKLDSLEKAVPALPLLVDSTLKENPTAEVATPNSADFWTRTWDKTVGVLKGMVEIRKLDTNDAMLLAPEQIYFVRSNLRLRLLDARLALLQHNGEVYKNTLSAIENTVKQYFDVQSPTTQKWVEELSALKNLDIHMVSDEALRESQLAVRNYQNTTKTANPVNLKPVEPLASVTLSGNSAGSGANTNTNSNTQNIDTKPENTQNNLNETNSVSDSAPASSPVVTTSASEPIMLKPDMKEIKDIKKDESSKDESKKDEPKKENKDNKDNKKSEKSNNKDKDNKDKKSDKDKKADSAGK